MARIGFICPVPVNVCKGSPLGAGSGKGKARYHGDDRQVRACQATYLMSQGYERISAREFRPVKGGEVLVLSKRPGTPVRTGKGDKNSQRGRPMADAHTKVAW